MRKSTSLLFYALLSILSFCNIAYAEEASVLKAKELANTLCVACHGADGISPVDLYPNLRGQGNIYLEKQLKDFRDGRRIDPIMNANAASLDDATIKALANYYANQD